MEGKVKVIVCTTAYRPFVGGAEIAIEEIAKRMSRDFDFYIVTARISRALPRRETAAEGTIIRIGVGTSLDKWLLPFFAVLRVRALIAGFKKTDRVLLWGMDISQGSLAALCIGWRIPRLPYVLTVQYGESEKHLQSGRLGFIRRAFRAMLMRADSVTAISAYLCDSARAHGFLGPCEVIPNGVDFEKFSLGDEKNAPRDGKTIITISRLVHKNGVDILIRAIAEVKKEIPDIRCRIAGDGPDRKKLEMLASFLGLTDIVTFLGTVPHASLAEQLRAADVFVRPARSEGMGNVFVEAAATGVPIIGTRVGGIPDIIEDGTTGLFAAAEDPLDCAQKIMRLLRDRAYAEALVANAREKIAARFDWNTIADRYRRVFRAASGTEKRITIAAGLFPPDIGGPATYSKSLVDALPQNRIGVRIAYFGAVRHLPRIVRHIAYGVRLIIISRGSDMIFAQDPVSVGLPALIVAKALRIRFVLKIVGDYAWEQGSQRFGVSDPLDEFLKNKYGWKVELLRGLQKWSASRAHAIIVPSEYLRDVVAQWGIVRERITVIYNAFDPPASILSKDEARRKLGISGTMLVSVGRLVPWKGFEAVIEVVRKLRADVPDSDIRLRIIGDGPMYVEDLIRANELGLVIQWMGSLSHEDVLTSLIAGDIFILNTKYEGLSHTLLEAMALGIPICTTRAGGNTELIRDGENGLFFDWNDVDQMRAAVMRLVRDPDLARALAGRAQEKARSFSSERMLHKTITLLKDV